MKVTPELIEQCRNGDRRSQYELYRQCFNILMSICIRYKKDEQEASAALNKGFLKIVQNLDKYKPKVPFDAWIRRIMINTVIDEYRKNRKVRELIEYTDYSNPEKYVDQVDYNIADQVFDAEQLESFIQMLPPMSRKVFNLFAIDGYSHKEVAESLDISVGTSKWHLSFARKRIQETMQKALAAQKKIRYGK